MLRTLSTVLMVTSALVAGQRPSFAGSRPIGFPETPNRTTTTAEGLGDRFGEGTTERLPIEANGDRDLIDRLSKLPIDKQPFWFINWQALEAHRKNPQSYPQRPSVFVDPVPQGGGGEFSNNNQGFFNNNPGFSNSNQGFSNSNQGFSSSNQGFSSSNPGFSNNNQGFSNSNQRFPNSQGFSSPNLGSNNNADPNTSFTNSINGVSISDLLLSNQNSGNVNSNPGVLSHGNPGFTTSNQGFSVPNQGFSPPNQVLLPPNQGSPILNQGFSPPNQGFAPPNQPFLSSNQVPSPQTQGIPYPNQEFSKPQGFSHSEFSNQHFESKIPGRVNVSPSIDSRFSSTSHSSSSASTASDKPSKPGVPIATNTTYNYKWNKTFHHTYAYNYKTNSSYYVPNEPIHKVTNHDIIKLD